MEILSDNPSIQVRVVERVFDAVRSRVGLEPILEAGQEKRYLLKVQFESEDLIRPGTACTVTVL